MIKGLVFNIQRYSIHDGGGIRTIVFFKGCPLKCPWCSNPESRKEVEPVIWHKNGKTETVGEWMTVEEVVKEVMKDEIFYRTSGGGVTLSGGEVLMQSAFAKELLKALYDLGIHTAIETTGCYEKERLASLLPFVNQILFDIKIMDRNLARKVIGIDVKHVKENLEMALTYPDLLVTPRIPLIPEFTTEKTNLQAIADYLNGLGLSEVHILPFHQYGSSKYDYLGWEYQMKDISALSEEESTEIQHFFASNGILANIDGLE